MNRYFEQYQAKLTSVAGIASAIKTGWNCCSDIAQGIPYDIYTALSERAAQGHVSGLSVYSLMDMCPLPFYEKDLGEKMKGFSWFSGRGSRYAVTNGYGESFPCYYRDVPTLIHQFVRVDAFLAVVSPMDEHGYFSFGSVCSCTPALLQKARNIYLQVNSNMPRALAGPQIHISQVTAVCESDSALPALPPVKCDPVSETIGNLVAEEIPDGATIQLGVGAIPEAITNALQDKHDLGIHTELFTDGMVDLIERGIVTNARKPIHTDYTVATFALGGEKVRRFIHENPCIRLMPVDYVNSPSVIAQHPDFISVNAALEVDFLGQVCAESIGTRHMSGTGGQSDYVRGATSSKGGKSFIVFPSTAKGGTVSRIVSTLTPGSSVSTSKNDVDYVATEFGIAKLRGKTISQRTRALIAIAHPQFRDALTYEAKKRGILV